MDPLRNQITDPTMARLLAAMEVLMERNYELPGQVILCFLYVASRERCHKQALEEELGMTTASASRNTDYLSKYHRLGKRGMDLIIKEVDPLNKRRVQLRLSAEGKRVAALIKRKLHDNTTATTSESEDQQGTDQDL